MPASQTPKPGSGLNPWLRYSGLGLQFAVTIALCTGLGYLADAQLGSQTPWLTILGALLGTATAIALIIRATNPRRS
jgi:F0F1-type ATP synthase assembly protein I